MNHIKSKGSENLLSSTVQYKRIKLHLCRANSAQLGLREKSHLTQNMLRESKTELRQSGRHFYLDSFIQFNYLKDIITFP